MSKIQIKNIPKGAEVSNYLYLQMDDAEKHQDLLTIALPNGYVISVGWFPEFDPSGAYWIRTEWDTGEREWGTTTNLSEVQAVVEALVQYYSRPVVSRTASSAADKPAQIECYRN